MRNRAVCERSTLPVACSLAEPVLARRRQELAEDILAGALGADELDDGYAFAFPGSAEWANRLVGMINAERACCPFFAFELAFEPGGGQIVLRVRGPEGAKEFFEAELLGLRAGLTGARAQPEL
jgi:hypothetical protein